MDWNFHNDLNKLIDEGVANGTAGVGTRNRPRGDAGRSFPWRRPVDFSNAVDRVEKRIREDALRQMCFDCDTERGVKLRRDCHDTWLCQKCYEEEVEAVKVFESWPAHVTVAKRTCQECDRELARGEATVCPDCLDDGRTVGGEWHPAKKPPPDNSWLESETIEEIDWSWIGRFARGLAYGWILVTAEGTIPWIGKAYHEGRKRLSRSYAQEFV